MDPSNKNILDVYIKTLRSLECPVCYEYFSSTVFQCNAGHVLCGNCKKDISDCPTCRTSLPANLRVRKLEEISEGMIFPCRNDGCDHLMLAKDLRVHENNCTHRSGKVKDGDQNSQHSHIVLLHHIEETIVPFLEIKSDKITVDEESQTDNVERTDASTSTHFRETHVKGPYFMNGVMIPMSSLSKESLIKGQETQVYGFLDSAKNYLGSHLNNNTSNSFPQINVSESVNEMLSLSNSFSSHLGQWIENLGEKSSSIVEDTSDNTSKYTLRKKTGIDSTSQIEIDNYSTTESLDETLSDSVGESIDTSKSSRFSELLESLFNKQDNNFLVSSMKRSGNAIPTSKESTKTENNGKNISFQSEQSFTMPSIQSEDFSFNIGQFNTLNKNETLSSNKNIELNTMNKKYLLKNKRPDRLLKQTKSPFRFEQLDNAASDNKVKLNNSEVFVFKGLPDHKILGGGDSTTNFELPKDTKTDSS